MKTKIPFKKLITIQISKYKKEPDSVAFELALVLTLEFNI